MRCYEAAAIADGVSGYGIKSISDGRPTAAPQRDEYFPVFFSTEPKTSVIYGMEKHRRALGLLVARLFELFGKKPPADPVEIAAAFTALGRGMALMSKAGEAGRAGKIIVIFLKALIESAAQADS